MTLPAPDLDHPARAGGDRRCTPSTPPLARQCAAVPHRSPWVCQSSSAKFHCSHCLAIHHSSSLPTRQARRAHTYSSGCHVPFNYALRLAHPRHGTAQPQNQPLRRHKSLRSRFRVTVFPGMGHSPAEGVAAHSSEARSVAVAWPTPPRTSPKRCPRLHLPSQPAAPQALPSHCT